MHDALFRTNSAVVLPEGEAPGQEHAAVTGIGLFALALRFAEENPGKKLFIAGHTDTTASVDFNQTLSEERAQCALAVLEGDRDAFVGLVDARHTVADYKQILSWCSKAFADVEFDCDPGIVDDNAFTAIEPLKRFQAAYNRNKAAVGASSQPDLVVDGDIGPKTWGAMFDVYQFGLRDELGEDEDGLAELRDKLAFVDDERKALGFSEHHPVDQVGRDNVRSQSNRRVELMFFDTGEEPDLVLAESDPDVSELYLPAEYEHQTIPPREGGSKPHRLFRVHLLDPTGAAVEERVHFRVRQDDIIIAEDDADDGLARFHTPLCGQDRGAEERSRRRARTLIQLRGR